MIERGHALPLAAQARQPGTSRGGIYRLPRAVPYPDLAVMRGVDESHLSCPFAGSRMPRDPLWQEGLVVGRRHVATLMKPMRIEALCRRPNTSKPAPGHKVYPCLLRKVAVTRPDQVWATDITYVPMARGFVCPVAVVDWYARACWRGACRSCSIRKSRIEALEEALARYAKPAILNSDQGSQFTSTAFTTVLHCENVAISMDGKGCRRDTVFAERLWRWVKYEDVYLDAHALAPEARAGIGRYVAFHNAVRPHPALGGRTPDQPYFDQPPLAAA